MNRDGELRTIQAFRDVFGTATRDHFCHEMACPVLVEITTVTRAFSDAPVGFHTEHIPSEQVMQQYMRPGMEEVFRVASRPGAVFSAQISVGRTKNVDVSIARSGISKYHAYFETNPDGQLHLIDKKSTNGTFVDDEKLSPGVAKAIEDGAQIRFGTHAFRFLIPTSFFAFLNHH